MLVHISGPSGVLEDHFDAMTVLLMFKLLNCSNGFIFHFKQIDRETKKKENTALRPQCPGVCTVVVALM